nr:putative ribonuclease H-like domain-containing protein [Tanacetum cinerariifolium]
MPPKPDFSFSSLEEFVNEPIVTEPIVKKPVVETSEAKTNSEDEAESKPKIEKKIVKPSFAKIEFVKSKEQVKSPRKTTVKQDYEEIDRGYVAFGGNPKGGKINGKGSVPDWLFDIDALTRTMNYEPITACTQSNGFAGSKLCDNAGQARKEKELVKDYILLPLWTANPSFFQNPKSSQDDGFQPSSDSEKKVDEDLSKGSKCRDQEKDDNVNSTNNVNAASTNGVNIVCENICNALLFDPDMLALEDISTFNSSSDHENDDEEADMNNMDTSIIIPLLVTKEFWFVTAVRVRDRCLVGLIYVRACLVVHTRGCFHLELSRWSGGFLVRLFLAYASFKDFVVYQIDVKSAFLHGMIEEEVYVYQPLGYEDPYFPNKVYKVKKALYKLHQAPRVWYETLSTYLLDNGFHREKIDKTLFIRRHKGDILLVQVYVNDIIFGSTKKELCNSFEKMTHEKFQMSSMGELTLFLGLQVKQKQDGIFIGQDKYVTEIIKKYGFLEVKNSRTVVTLIRTNPRQHLMSQAPKGLIQVVVLGVNTPRSDEDSLKLKELMELCKPLQSRVLALEQTKATQATKIDSLKRMVKKIEKKQRSRTYKLKRLYKVGLTARVESSNDEDLGEDASKQGRISDIDANEEVDAAQIQVTTAVTTPTILIDEVTLAQALAELKHIKPKAKAKVIVFHEPEESTTTTETTTPKQKSQDKGEAKMIEETTCKRRERERAQQKEAANIVLIESRDDVQAKIDADYLLVERLQAKEQQELNDEEKAKLFMQLLEKRRKFFAAKRAGEKRNKPPIQAQQRKIMCTYLKNMEGKKLTDLKNKSFDSIQKMFDKAFKRYKFSLPVKVVATARRFEMPLPEVCTAIEEKKKKLPVKYRWQLH